MAVSDANAFTRCSEKHFTDLLWNNKKMIEQTISTQSQIQRQISQQAQNIISSSISRPTSRSYYLYAVIAVLILASIVELIFLQAVKQSTSSRQETLQTQIDTLKQHLQDHSNKEESIRQIQKVKLDMIRMEERERFFYKKAKKIRELLKNNSFLSNNERARTSFHLALNNYRLIHQNVVLTRQINKILQEEYERLSKLYDFTLLEESFCVVVPSINNVQNYRNEYNLQSIMNQNYSNYRVIIIDDASSDHNAEAIRQFIDDHPVPQEIILVKNKVRKMTVANLYTAAHQYCKPNEIMLVVDGDDELLGVNIFKVFNALYITHGLQVVYSNYVRTINLNDAIKGISKEYTQKQKRENAYREDSYTRVFPVRSFRVGNFLKVKASDLQSEGEWFKSASDHAIYTPLMELSCGKSRYVDEYFYLYNDGHGSNDLSVDPSMNIFVNNYVRYNLTKYTCQQN